MARGAFGTEVGNRKESRGDFESKGVSKGFVDIWTSAFGGVCGVRKVASVEVVRNS
jgi:hypothetical protein